MAEHIKAKAGRWTYTAVWPDEHVGGEQWFDTKDEAIAACRVALAGLWSDMECGYVVRCACVVDADLIAPHLAWAIEWMLESGDAGANIAEEAECGTDEPLFVRRVPPSARDDLHQFLRGWLAKHELLSYAGTWMADGESVEEVSRG